MEMNGNKKLYLKIFDNFSFGPTTRRVACLHINLTDEPVVGGGW